MPIKKRSQFKKPEGLPELAAVPRNPEKKDKPKKPVKSGKPLKNVKRRKLHPDAKSEYVYPDGHGHLVVKTPRSATKWDHEFRLRIIRDWTKPRTLMRHPQFVQKYMEGLQDAVYKVEGKRLYVRHPYEIIEGNNVIVLRTEVVDADTNTAMFLHHNDPAIRVLMVYSFIHDKSIGGVPRIETYPFEP